MKIEYLGHSSFCLIGESGLRIVTDPYGEIGYSMPRVSADVALLSHGHYDHSNTAALSGDPVIIRSAGEFCVSDARICAYPSFHDAFGGRKRGSNLVFTVELDGLTVCHLGDIGEPCREELLSRLGNIDVLFVPVGGNYTIDGTGAMEYIRRIRPAVAIPMHFKTPDLNIDIAPLSDFPPFREGNVTFAGAEYRPVKRTGPYETEILIMERKKI